MGTSWVSSDASSDSASIAVNLKQWNNLGKRRKLTYIRRLGCFMHV